MPIPAAAGLVDDVLAPRTARDALTLELLASSGQLGTILSHRSGGSASLTDKHAYTRSAFYNTTLVSQGYGMVQSLDLNDITLSDDYTGRIGSEIINKRVTIRGTTHIGQTGGFGGYDDAGNPTPFIRYALVREKIATGFLPVSFVSADSAIPGTSFTPLSNLGAALYQRGCYWRTAVHNPISSPITEIVKMWDVPEQRPMQGAAETTRVELTTNNAHLVQPETYHWTHEIDLGDTHSVFPATGFYPLDNPVSNRYTLQCLPWDPSNPNAAGAGGGVLINHTWTADLVFNDAVTR